MSGTFNINQINVNVTDVIPPDNFATVDAGSKIGTVYTKAQDNEWRAEVEATTQSGIKGVLKPNTPYDPVTNPYPTPWAQGDSPLFEIYVVNESGSFPNTKDIDDENINVTPTDLELNEIQIWIKNGVAELHKKAMPQASVNVRKWESLQSTDFPLAEGSQVVTDDGYFIVPEGKTANSSDVPGESANYKSIGKDENVTKILDFFLLNDAISISSTDPSLNWTSNILKNNNTKESTGLAFVTALNIPTEGRDFLDINLIRYSTVQQFLDQYSSILGLKSNGTVEVVLIGKLNTLPKVMEHFVLDVSAYESVSICYDLVDISNPDPNRPTITLYSQSSGDNTDNVLKYINAGDEATKNYADSLKPNVYKDTITNIIINIDSFTGTDDQKIEKAFNMAENVNGGTVYFPDRQINITKSILFISNVDLKIDGQIQMANNIHDNILRPKNLIVNPAEPSGKCLNADWTENFNVFFGVNGSVRQSVVPLHTGGQYGWRGVSMLFVRCRFYKVHNPKVIESHMWSISNEFSEDAEFYNLNFQNTLYVNADGFNVRNGCKRIYAKTIRGFCTDNAVATTVLDSTLPSQYDTLPGYSYQALGWSYGDFSGADEIIVEDCQVAAQYGQGLIIASGYKVSNITYKDFVASTPTANDWDNVSVCANRYRGTVYGTSFVVGNLKNINIINSKSTIHEYSLSVYGQVVQNLFAIGTLGNIKNDTGTVINPV